MKLTAGTRLGPYEILAPIGAGGMGEVFRARDTRLDRTVAVKVLPPEFGSNTQLKQRFEREARSISKLNHPHICTLHDVGSHDGVEYLVMELIEGETLADRIARGPLPLPDVLKYGAQIAEALHVAHRAGIVHRDLKPGNIMITRSGAKLLDFGLARSASISAAHQPAATSLEGATEHKPLTQEGTILGTFQYMAPEQLEGFDADGRTDIFALGAVLYEMVTGKRAFEGKTKTSLIAAIVSAEPAPISSVTAMTPPALDHVVRRCLVKDPDERWQSARDVATELEWISEVGRDAGGALQSGVRRGGNGRLAWGLVALTSVALAGLVALFAFRPGWLGVSAESSEARAVTFELLPPVGGYVRSTGERAAPAAISPDGRRIVFGVLEPDGRNRLWLREVDSTEITPLPGTDGGSRPFWSPDGRAIGFFADAKLMRLDLDAGVALSLADAPEDRGGAWTPDGQIVFVPDANSPLLRVAATGGVPKAVTKLDRQAGESSHRYPAILADGRTVVFVVLPVSGSTSSGLEAEQSVHAVRLDTGERKLLLRGGANAQQAGDELLFYRGGSLRAQPIDLERLELTGAPRTVIADMKYDAAYEFASFSASDDTLVYEKGPYRNATLLTWFSADGTAQGTIGEEATQTGASISPDGRSVAVLRTAGESAGVWILDADGRQSRRVNTFTGLNGKVEWSPDGTRLAYSAVQENRLGTFIENLAEGTTERILEKSGSSWSVDDWSPDGTTLILTRNFDHGGMVYDIRRGGEPVQVIRGTDALNGQVSPDGRWLAYYTRRKGAAEVEITSYPRGVGRWAVSQGGGFEPRWSSKGDALFYRTPGGAIVRVAIDSASENLRIGRSVRLFQAPPIADIDECAYDVDSSGDRFLINGMIEKEAKIPITVSVGWRKSR